MNDRVIYHAAVKRSGHAFVGRMIRSWCDCPYVDMENFRISQLRTLKLKSNVVLVLQTRDLLNWWASYSRSRSTMNTGMGQIWYRIARLFYQDNLQEFKVVKVDFEQFFDSQEYRMGVCAALDGIYNEDKLHHIALNGGGSSFSRTKYDGNAQEMPILERWKQVDPKIYPPLFANVKGLKNFYLKHSNDPEKINFVNSL